MATWDDVRRLALALPETTEGTSRYGLPDWRVREKPFAWERPLRRADLAALGDAAPRGDVLAAWVSDPGEKDALLAAHPATFFTTPHFDGYAIVLVRLARIRQRQLRELLTDAWLHRAPKRLARAFLAPGSG